MSLNKETKLNLSHYGEQLEKKKNKTNPPKKLS